MEPVREIGQEVSSNINLLPGDSGAEASLPAYYNEETKTFTSRWKLSLKERLKILFSGSIWLSVMSLGHPPVRIDIEEPKDLFPELLQCVCRFKKKCHSLRQHGVVSSGEIPNECWFYQKFCEKEAKDEHNGTEKRDA